MLKEKQILITNRQQALNSKVMKGITTSFTGNIGSSKTISNSNDVSTSVSVAVDDSYKLKDQTEWTKRTTWVEVMLKGDQTATMVKGAEVSVKGKVTAHAYINKEDKAVGNIRIVNARVSFIENKLEELATAE